MTKLQEQILTKQALKNKNFIKQINKNKQKAKIKRLKSLGKDASLLFLPIVSEMILQHISDIGNIFSNIEDEIEQLNNDIDQFNNYQIGNKNNLINRKNALLNQINLVEKKIDSINKLLSKLDIIIKTFQIISTTLKVLPLPTAPIPTTAGILNTFSNLLEKSTKIISAFKAITNIAQSELNDIKSNLEDLKNQIKLIENNIENPEQLTFEDILSTAIKLGTQSITHNGFKFAISEENKPNSPLINNTFKRHYAVAIDLNGVEVLKTEPSFTLDTQVLIDSLILIIDKNNLKP